MHCLSPIPLCGTCHACIDCTNFDTSDVSVTLYVTSDEIMLLAMQIILSSPRGRAWNEYSPSLGSTMNVAFLAQVYSAYIKPGCGTYAKKAKRYSCWAQTQVRTDVA